MIELDILNFRVIRELHLSDPTKLSIILGYNESGKSSLVRAISFAVTGEAFGLKGSQIGQLVRHGETRLSVSVRLGSFHAHRTTTSGDSQKVIAQRLGVPVEYLPLMFDAHMCGDGGNRHMKAFLNGAASCRFNALAHFADDPAVRPYLEMGVRAGKTSTKQLVQYCESVRADQKEPPAPVRPSTMEPGQDQIQAVAEAIVSSQADLNAAQAKEIGFIAEARTLATIWDWLKAQAEYDKKKDALSGAEDRLGEKRAYLEALVRIQTTPLQNLSKIFHDATGRALAGISTLLADLQSTQAWALQALKENPLPETLKPVLPLTPPVYSFWEKAGKPNADAIAIRLKELSALEQEAKSLKNMHQGRLTETQTKAQEQQQSIGAWKQYRQSMSGHDEAVEQSRLEWKRWDHAAKAVLAAEQEFLRTTGNQFGQTVASFSKTILQGRSVSVDAEQGIKLGNEPIEETSESTRWRIELAVMASINKLLRCPLLLIDGADVLDIHNKQALTTFLMENIVPAFEHVILTATPPKTTDDEAPAPDHLPVRKWIIDRGELRILAKKGTTQC